MTGERQSYPRAQSRLRASANRTVIRFGPFQVPVPVFACGLSVATHGALFTAAYFAPWTPAVDSKPKIQLARGEHAIQVRILLDPWPEPNKTKEEAKPIVVNESETEPPLAVNVSAEPLEQAEPPDRPCEVVNGRQLAESRINEPTEDHVDKPTVLDAALDGSRLPLAKHSDGHAGAPHEVASRSSPVDHVTTGRFAERESDRDASYRKRSTDRSSNGMTAQPLPKAESTADVRPGVDTGVEVVNLPRPGYPIVSQRRGEQGLVLLQVEVLTNGRAAEITVLRDPGYPRLTKAAIEVVRKARFKPATRHGQPIRDIVWIPFRFVLE